MEIVKSKKIYIGRKLYGNYHVGSDGQNFCLIDTVTDEVWDQEGQYFKKEVELLPQDRCGNNNNVSSRLNQFPRFTNSKFLQHSAQRAIISFLPEEKRNALFIEANAAWEKLIEANSKKRRGE